MMTWTGVSLTLNLAECTACHWCWYSNCAGYFCPESGCQSTGAWNSFQTTEVLGWVLLSVNVDRRGLLESSTSSFQYETPLYWIALYSLVIHLKFGDQLRRPTDRPDSDLCMYIFVVGVVAPHVECFWIIGCARYLA